MGIENPLWGAPRDNGELLKLGFAIAQSSVVKYKTIWVNVTTNPTSEWVARQITEAFPWGEAPKYLIRDRDTSMALLSPGDCRRWASGTGLSLQRRRCHHRWVAQPICAEFGFRYTQCVRTSSNGRAAHALLNSSFNANSCANFSRMTRVGCSERASAARTASWSARFS